MIFILTRATPSTPEMEFTSKAKKIAEERAKKEKQRNEQREFAIEMAKIDNLIKARMQFIGKLFFSKFFIKNYTVSFSHNDLSWYMHGHVIQTDIYTSIAIRLRDDRLLYSLDYYLNDDIDQFK
ncbi:MAG: hypothetical protein ACTFAL_02750 [Candidatus Electronema sp. V4]|uniref:hypothetical protein n=1 Tax=Candidatus Electronema sp. V4 TaxID=3454756 RepID=UPI0040555CFD